jgi:glucokinase
LYLDDAREHYAAAITGARHRPLARIRTTQLGEAAGMIGAAELARAALGPGRAMRAGGRDPATAAGREPNADGQAGARR